MITTTKQLETRIPNREEGLTLVERYRMTLNDVSNNHLPADDKSILDMDTSEEIERYSLYPWYHFMPVAIQIRPIDKKGSVFIDRHYTSDIAFSTSRKRMDWKAAFDEDPAVKCLILEDGEPWADFVAGLIDDALQSWANDHLATTNALSAEQE